MGASELRRFHVFEEYSRHSSIEGGMNQQVLMADNICINIGSSRGQVHTP